jgi:general secretion pathway protein C
MSVPALPAQQLDLASLIERVTASRWLPVAATLLTLGLLTHSLAQWTWLILTPKSAAPVSVPVTTPEPDSGALLRDLLAANLFGVAEPGALSPNQIPETSLNLKLTGVMARGKGSFALIRVEGKDETPVLLGAEVLPGTRLHAVYADKVILARAGLYESLTLKDAVPGLAAGSIVSALSAPARSPVVRGDGSRFTLNRQSMTQTMQTPEFLTQAMIVPNAGGGFLVREVQPDGLYAKLGVRVGDVVRSINGQPVNTMDDVMKVYQQLGGVSQAGSVSIDVTRAGENKSLTYNFE